MRVLFSAIVLCVVATSSQAWATDSNFERTLSTNQAPQVAIFTPSGSVRVRSGSDNQIHVTAHIRSSRSGWIGGNDGLESQIRQIVANPPIHQVGDHITIGDRHASSLYRNIAIDYELTMPRDSTIETETGSGDIETTDVGSSLRAQSGSGSVRARGLHGSATLSTGSGDIELHETAAGDVRAQTGSGSIRLQGVSGALHANTGSGDIDVSGSVTSDWTLDTGSGSVRLDLGPQTRFTLDADTGSGNVRVAQAISMSGDLNRHHVIGNVNGGGPTLHIRSGSGDIQIR